MFYPGATQSWSSGSFSPYGFFVAVVSSHIVFLLDSQWQGENIFDALALQINTRAIVAVTVIKKPAKLCAIGDNFFP